MTTESNQIVRLAATQTSQAVEVLTRAFQNDPMYVQIFPDEDERARSMSWLWDAVIRYSLVYGEVHTTPGVGGLACWLSPGNAQITFWRMLRTGLRLQRAVMRFRAPAPEETFTRGAHPVARKYAGVLARGLRPVLSTYILTFRLSLMLLLW